jgi:hypothetical protein
MAVEDRLQKPSHRLDGLGPVIAPGQSFGSVTDKIASIVQTPTTHWGWIVGFGIGFTLVQLLGISVTYLFLKGTYIWGLNIPVGWGLDILNFVWWIGIGHAGTLISAILLLFRQSWRTSINRFAEAMTLFAVACAGMYPVIHTGRPWLAYWLLPYPNTMGMWPNFRSPLIWDVFAVSTYATVSLLFWFVGLIPDLATLRDRSENSVGPDDLRPARHGLARLGPALATLRNGLPAARRALDAAGAVRAHHRVLRLRRRPGAGLARRRCSRRTSSPARSSPASRW